LSMLFGEPYGNPVASYRDASPISHAADASAPFLLIHGEDDELVPVAQSRAMARALKLAGKDVQLLCVRHAGHNLAPLPVAATEPSREEINRILGAFFDRALRSNG